MTSAIYPGTFDPFTNGHLDILIRASSVFEKLFVCIAQNSNKPTSCLTPDERKVTIEKTAKSLELQNIEVVIFNGLLVEVSKNLNSPVIVRGIRAASDFDYEFQMACVNNNLDSNVQTVFFPSSHNRNFVSSSVVRSVYSLGGDVSGFVPPASLECLEAKRGIGVPNASSRIPIGSGS